MDRHPLLAEADRLDTLAARAEFNAGRQYRRAKIGFVASIVGLLATMFAYPFVAPVGTLTDGSPSAREDMFGRLVALSLLQWLLVIVMVLLGGLALRYTRVAKLRLDSVTRLRKRAQHLRQRL